MAFGALLLSGCGLLTGPVTVPTSPAPVEVTSAASKQPTTMRIGPVMVPAVTEARDRDATDGGCATVVRRFTTAAGDFEAAVLIPGCVGTTTQAMNGNHGYHPAPPVGATTEQAQTPVGTATLFSSQYTECTNSCSKGTDEVALLTVDGVVVQIIAVTAPANGTRSRSRTDLVQLLKTLTHA